MKLGFIGCGNMGEAILAGNYKKHSCLVCEPRAERRAYLKKKFKVSSCSLAELLANCEVILLAVKPQDFPALLADIAGQPFKGKLFVSIAAGIRTAFLEQSLRSARVVRVMPNLPAMIGEGVSAVCRGRSASVKDLALVQDIFSGVGISLVLKESQMDAVTAVSGSGPGYIFLVAECMITAARDLGFTEKEARTLVQGTLTGSSRLLAGSKDSAAGLRAMVTSRGGTTQAAMDVFMAGGMPALFVSAMTAARDRAKELAR